MSLDSNELFDILRSSKPVQITKRKLVLCEGVEDQRFFGSLFKFLNLENSIQSIIYFGKYNFRTELNAILNIPGFDMVESLMITRDADTNYQQSLQSVCDALKHCDLPVPPSSEIYHTGSIKVGIFIFPSKEIAGCLEDLCIDAVKETPQFPCVDSYFKCLNDLPIDTKHLSKAKLKVYLASIDGSISDLKIASERKCWSFDSSQFRSLIDFIRQL